MQRAQIRIRPRSAFGSPLRGDTLFGQLAWAIRHRYGESRLQSCLQGYGQGAPFLVMSDAFPAGHFPRPTLPISWYTPVSGDHKVLKQRAWLPQEHLFRPLPEWLGVFVSADALPAGGVPAVRMQSHNRIDRRSGTTSAEFAPYTQTQRWYATDTELDLYCVWDPQKISQAELQTVLTDVGDFGYGRDATLGLGKFQVHAVQDWAPPLPEQPTSYWSLAPCVPQGGDWDAERSFYQPFTRFGKHGDMGVHSGNPFKAPVLMADTGAVLTPRTWEDRWIVGTGPGGDGTLSHSLPATVQQGYAPVIAIRLPHRKELSA